MAVSKRTRYEVLRRDNHTCRYCGGTAPDVTLTVDHVTPTALGGSDDPSNLVAACRDCNAGKAASNPDAPLVADVARDALRWAAAMQAVAHARGTNRDRRDHYADVFDDTWQEWGYGPDKVELPRPADWRPSIWRFYEAGLPVDELLEAAAIACGNARVRPSETWRYFCGICWRKLTEIQEAASVMLEAEETPGSER